MSKTSVLGWQEPGALETAVSLIRSGRLVAFPTETVYGLGARYDTPSAVQGIFSAKGRPADNPLIVHVDSVGVAKSLVCGWTWIADCLADAFWPGPLTLVLRRAPSVPDEVTAGLDTVALRMPAHPCALALISAAGPIAAPSANRSGRPSPTCVAHVFHDLNGRIPLVLDGGHCARGLESTVVDASGEIPAILRPGHVTAEDVERVAGAVRIAPGVLEPLPEGERAASPGLLHRHYAPQNRVLLFCGREEAVVHARMALVYRRLRAEGHRPLLVGTGLFPGLEARRVRDVQELAARFYGILLDSEREYTHLLVQGVGTEGVGLAVMNRALRSAGFSVENVDKLEETGEDGADG